MTSIKLRIRNKLRSFLGKLLQPELTKIISNELKSSPATQIALCERFNAYQRLSQNGGVLPNLNHTGFRVYSQNEEDGILLYIFGLIGIKTKRFVEIGSSNGVECNCANLALNMRWTGLFIDGNEKSIAYGRKYYEKHKNTWIYPPKFVCAYVNRENIDGLIKNSGVTGEIDLLSIDIDGNDYWVWTGVKCVNPRVVIIETHVEYQMQDIVFPYDPNYSYPGINKNYHGASPVAMTKLANKLGYRLVGAIGLGFNAIFLRNDTGLDLLPEVSVESILAHPRNREQSQIDKYENVKHLQFVTPA